jgi:hypothetical protein
LAIDTFIELDVNPAKIVALYPEIVAGRLALPQERWIPLFGGPAPVHAHEGVSTPSSQSSSSSRHKDEDKDKKTPLERTAADLLDGLSLPASGSGTIRGRLKGLGAMIGAATRDDDASSIHSTKPKHSLHGS